MLLLPNTEQIKKLREKAKMSQHQLSLQAGLNGNAVCRIESGEVKRTHHLRAREIARALNCDVREIFDIPNKESEGTT